MSEQPEKDYTPDALTALIERVERHKVVSMATGETTGYMLPADEWREIRAGLRRLSLPTRAVRADEDVEWDEGRCICGHAPSSHQFGGQECHLCGCRYVTYSPGPGADGG